MANPKPSTATGITSDTPVLPDVPNPRGYPPFNLRLLLTYTNNQLCYYHISGAMLDVDEDELARQMNKRYAALKAVNWDGDTRENTPKASLSSYQPPPPPSSASRTLSFDPDNEPDSECPKAIAGFKGIKINPSDIPQLKYTNNVAQFNNWLTGLQSAFKGDPARYPTNTQKIIMASITLDE